MTIEILNFLHRHGLQRLNSFLSMLAYRLKGSGPVLVRYLDSFRGYSYKMKGLVYISIGPGWAYSFDYLKQQLEEGYNYYFLPGNGDVVIDIGAGLGEESVIYSQLVGQRGAVYAIEANPVTYAGLEYMRRENNFFWMKTFNLAIFSEKGTVDIEDDERNYLSNTIGTRLQQKHFTVQAKTLDEIVAENGITRIDFLKSNIEGAERFLIKGMGHSLAMIRNACICCHDFREVYHGNGEFYLTKQLIIDFFTKNGFEVTSRQTGNHCVDDYIYLKKVE